MQATTTAATTREEAPNAPLNPPFGLQCVIAVVMVACAFSIASDRFCGRRTPAAQEAAALVDVLLAAIAVLCAGWLGVIAAANWGRA